MGQSGLFNSPFPSVGMKLLVAFGLVAAALASWESSPIYQGSERSFVKGNTYIFSYDGQSVSGVAAKGSSSHSIQQASGKVYVTVGDKYWTMRGDDIKFTYGQRKMEEPRTFEKLTSLEEQQLTDEQIAILRLPVRFRYHQGIITDVHFTERDNAWSENLKRSVLSMLQMQLSPKTPQAQEFSTVGEKEIDENNKYFTQPERVLEGECEVAYTIVDGEKKDEKEITKSLNFNKCSKRVDIRYGFRFNSECETCLEEDARPESQVVVNYKVKGDDKSFLIKEINLKSEYLFTPFSTQQQMLATYQHVIMRLIKIVETERSEEPQWSNKKSTIMYNYEKELAREQFWMNGDEESWKNSGFEFLPKKEIVEKAVQQMIESIDESAKDGVKLDSTHQMARIVIVLRMCNREEMMEIHRFVCENNKYTKEQQKKINEIMADALAIAGTKVTVEHLIEKIEKKQISPLKAALTLKSLVNVRVSSEKIVDMVLRFSKSKVAREEPALRQSAMLTSGALMNVMCGKNQERWAVEIDGSKKCTREQKMSWLSTFKSLYTESSDKYDKVLVLKTLANSGMDVCVHFLEDIIYSKSEETILRSTAIDALRMIREEMPRKVQSLLLPIFKSRHQPLSLRMSAVYQIVQSKPALPVLEQIVDTLNRESSHQLRSFCYSLLRSFEESANPCEKQLSNDVTVVLRSLRFRPSLESRHFHASTFSQSLDLGLTVDFASVLTNESILPRELLSSFDSLFSGQWSKHLAQVGFSQQNLDSILIPLLNKLEKVETESVVRGLRSEKKQAISESLKGLVNQMKIAVRRSDSREEPFGMLYIRYKNLDYAVLPIDESIISKYTRSTGVSSLSELLRDLAKGQRFNVAVASFIYERNRVFPTSIGVPLLTTQRIPTLAVVEGQVKMEISSARPTLRLQMEPSIASTHVTEMQLLTPLQQAGARVFHSIQATLPIDSTIEYDWERQQLKTIVRPPTSEKRVMIFETRPVNFVRSFSHRGSPMVQEKTISLARLERNAVHYEHVFGEKLTGIKAEVFGSVHRHMFNTQDKLEAILYGENHVQLNLIPTEKAIKEIVFEIEPKWTSEKNGLQSPRYNEGFEEVDFRMEDSEEENEWEPEQKRSSRHTETKRYYEKKIGGENKKGIEGRVVIKGYTVGGPKELKARFEVMGECEQDGKYCRVEVQGKRSPLLADETREWELDCKAELVFPESPKSIRELREQKHREMQATISFRWGAHEKNEIKMKIQAEQDREMQKLVRDIKWENEDDKKKGTISQLETLKEASRLNKLSVLVNHDLTKKNEKIFEQLYSLIKARYFIESEVESTRRTKGSLLVKMVVDPQECRRVNVTLETSEEKLSIPSILSPIRLPLPSIAKTSSVKFYNKVNDIIRKQSTCEVRSSKITTFDDLTYKTPMTTCYQVLAKDCSQEPEYAVLMKNIKKNSEEKKLKIITVENKEIEIEFDKEKEKFVCKIDGRRVENEETLSENGIELIGERTLEVVLPKIAVRFDGYMCEIKADKRTQNKQCGMCGHFDGHRDNEFRRADNEETEDLEDFHRSWLNKDSECEIEEYKLKEKTNYGFEENKESTEFDSEEDDFERVKKVKKMHKKIDYKDQEEETYEPIKKTIVIERSSKTCFSVEPQPACRHSDEAQETTQMKVKLACVPRGERKTRQMINMIKNEQYDEVSRLVNELEESFTESIRVPTLCRVF